MADRGNFKHPVAKELFELAGLWQREFVRLSGPRPAYLRDVSDRLAKLVMDIDLAYAVSQL
jgi:hypothetical protein